jgi:BASS family bile acid:Na+ symporter
MKKLILAVVLLLSAVVLSWLGRQGTRAVAALIVIGIAMPSIGRLLKPFVTEAVFLLVDAAAFRIYLRRPTIVLAATARTPIIPTPAPMGRLRPPLGQWADFRKVALRSNNVLETARPTSRVARVWRPVFSPRCAQ